MLNNTVARTHIIQSTVFPYSNGLKRSRGFDLDVFLRHSNKHSSFHTLCQTRRLSPAIDLDAIVCISVQLFSREPVASSSAGSNDFLGDWSLLIAAADDSSTSLSATVAIALSRAPRPFILQTRNQKCLERALRSIPCTSRPRRTLKKSVPTERSRRLRFSRLTAQCVDIAHFLSSSAFFLSAGQRLPQWLYRPFDNGRAQSHDYHL